MRGPPDRTVSFEEEFGFAWEQQAVLDPFKAFNLSAPGPAGDSGRALYFRPAGLGDPQLTQQEQAAAVNPADETSALIRSAWLHFCQRRPLKLSGRETRALSEISVEQVGACLFADAVVANSPRGIRLTKRFSRPEREGLNALLIWLEQPDFAVRMVEAALADDCLRMPWPFAPDQPGAEAVCTESYMVGETNVLRFAFGTESAFLLQNVTSADALYLPSRNLIILKRHTTKLHIIVDVTKLLANFDQFMAYALEAAGMAPSRPGLLRSLFNRARINTPRDRRFGGILASHSRPYHFYYDVVPVMAEVTALPDFSRTPTIFSLRGGNFYRFSAIFGTDVPEICITPRGLNRLNSRDGTFTFRVGAAYKEGYPQNADAVDERILHHARTHLDQNTAAEVAIAARCFPLVWIGVTGQKRQWREQAQLVGHLVRCWRATYPEIGFVFDGWTVPLNWAPGTQMEIARDTAVMTEAMRDLPPDVPVFSVIGANSIRKLAFAQLCDFSIANSTAGNIHVTRIAQRPGVGHINNKMIEIRDKVHLQRHTIQVPPEAVTDLPSDENMAPDKIDYSIDVDTVEKLARPLLLAIEPVERAKRVNSVLASLKVT